jgi:hypothetical protein
VALKDSRSVLALLCLFATGCVSDGRNQTLQEVRERYAAGQLEEARVLLDEFVASKPADLPLALLERALLLQRLGDFEASRDDFLEVDEEFEVIDFSGEPGDDFALLQARPGMAEYRGTPYEKILLNTLNILNHLALSDLEQGRVEARRAMVMHDSVVDYERQQQFESPLTQLLYGLLFEASGRHNEAHLAYKNAYEQTAAEFLGPRLIQSARETNNSDLVRWQTEFEELPASSPEGAGTVIVVLMSGSAPVREPTVLPDRSIRYAHLVPQPRSHQAAEVRLGDESGVRLVSMLDIETQAMDYFERVELRTLSGARLARLQSRGKRRMFNIVDTRSWTLLPAEVLVAVVSAPAGFHEVELSLEGEQPRVLTRQVMVEEAGFVVVPFFVPD